VRELLLWVPTFYFRNNLRKVINTIFTPKACSPACLVLLKTAHSSDSKKTDNTIKVAQTGEHLQRSWQCTHRRMTNLVVYTYDPNLTVPNLA
jgi:hypothetical protein